MPVYQLLESMPYEELLKWIEFFKERPNGWQEDQRTFLLMKMWGFKGSPESIFPTLKFMKQHSLNKQENDRAIPKGKFLDMMIKAKHGDDSGWKPTRGK